MTCSCQIQGLSFCEIGSGSMENELLGRASLLVSDIRRTMNIQRTMRGKSYNACFVCDESLTGRYCWFVALVYYADKSMRGHPCCSEKHALDLFSRLQEKGSSCNRCSELGPWKNFKCTSSKCGRNVPLCLQCRAKIHQGRMSPVCSRQTTVKRYAKEWRPYYREEDTGVLQANAIRYLES